jgi:hypothetical protein
MRVKVVKTCETLKGPLTLLKSFSKNKSLTQFASLENGLHFVNPWPCRIVGLKVVPKSMNIYPRKEKGF